MPGDVQLQRAGRIGGGGRLRIDRLLQIARQAEVVLCLIGLEAGTSRVQLAGAQAGGAVAGLDAPLRVNPGQALKLRMLVDQGLGPRRQIIRIDLFVRDIAGNAHQLFLALQQVQSQALLGVFHVALHGLLVAVNFFQPKVRERRCNGSQK